MCIRDSYKSAKKGIISHGVFSMWIIGNYIPIVATRDSYYQQLISGYGQEYAAVSYTHLDVYKRQALHGDDLHIRSGAWPAQYGNCSAWRGCAYYLFPAEWCNFACYGIFDPVSYTHL